MTELVDIIAAATNASEPAANLLRKLLVLAHRLKNEELRQWVEKELHGYGKDDVVPAHRKKAAQAHGTFVGHSTRD